MLMSSTLVISCSLFSIPVLHAYASHSFPVHPASSHQRRRPSLRPLSPSPALPCPALPCAALCCHLEYPSFSVLSSPLFPFHPPTPFNLSPTSLTPATPPTPPPPSLLAVTSAVGVLPLALQYGFEHVHNSLSLPIHLPSHATRHTSHEPPFALLQAILPCCQALQKLRLESLSQTQNCHIPLLPLATPFAHPQAILPYCQALQKLAPHIQQVSMESNGKGVSIDGEELPYECGEIDFGEPGTNGQHSFYQLIHQGRVVPCDFIGIIESQQPVYLKGEIVSNHDELMCNFFAQADALAYGKVWMGYGMMGMDYCEVGMAQMGYGKGGVAHPECF
ncbi:unnamed protein product [Closterium sp. NIES-54]